MTQVQTLAPHFPDERWNSVTSGHFLEKQIR